MSFQSSVAKLSSPVKDLVLAVSQDGLGVGKTEKDQVEVIEWVDKVGQGDIVKEEGFKDLDSQLIPRTYLVRNYLTAADVALYGALHPVVSKLQPPEYYSYPAVTRYFDHIQSSSIVRKAADGLSPSFTPVTFNLEDAPTIERKAEGPKKKAKAPSPVAAAVAEAPAVSSSTPEINTKDKPQQKKEKKDKATAAVEGGGKKKAAGGGGSGGGGGKAAAPVDEDPVPSMVDLRVGRIIEIMKHPDADSLYVEKIDLGEETGPRTVVSGLVKYVPIEEMQNRLLVAVCNFKPANLKGIKSFALVLCACAKEGKDVGGIEVVVPPANAQPGDRVYWEGFEDATPVSQMNPKKKIWETVQPGFITLENREAAWVNAKTGSVHKLRTKDGVVVAPTLAGASLA